MIRLITTLVVMALLYPIPGYSQPQFSDVTTQAGIANSLSGNQVRLATNLAWGDYDGDGDLDLYITNWGSSISPVVSTNRLYRNNGNGSFTDVAGSTGVTDTRNSIDAHWADYDNDGNLDLYVVNFSEQDQLYKNNGNGSFSQVTGSAAVNVISQGSEVSGAWGDYDGDGDLDFYLCKYYFRNSFFVNNGNGTFFEDAVGMKLGDIRDSEHAAWGDYDGDGDLDLYVVNREQNNALYRNDGTSFVEVACALSLDNTDVGKSARWIDYDTDGDLDLFLTNIGANALYRNDGNGLFVNIASGDTKSISGSWISWSSAWGDFDADGDPDVVVANGADSQDGQVSPLLLNVGDGTFEYNAATGGVGTSRLFGISAGSADYDDDGDLDFYLLNSRFPTYPPGQLYRNETSGVNTVKVRPKRKGAADGIGARVRLLAGSQLLGHQQISSDSDAQEAVFGVQPGSSFTVEVNFSDGSIVSRSNVSSGTTIEIQQQ
jgi:hypothetical protein